MIAFNKTGWTCHQHWTPEELKTRGLSVRQAANKAGFRCMLGLDFVYLNEAPTAYSRARQLIGSKIQ